MHNLMITCELSVANKPINHFNNDFVQTVWTDILSLWHLTLKKKN